MIISFNILNDGEIRSEIYSFETDDFEILALLETTGRTILVKTSDLISPTNHLLNYLDESKLLQFTILDSEITEYLTENFPKLKFNKLL